MYPPLDTATNKESFTMPEAPTPAQINLDNHPCFNREACSDYGRVHLPVAPKCNIQCNFCNRDFDCVNESRPGVTSSVLSPGQALAYLKEVMKRHGNISVVGIAGPGDPFANPEETLETFRLVREAFPKMILCLSTNGLGLTEAHVKELAELQVSHVTLTINAVEPEIGGQVYSWARYEKRIFRGEKAGALMIEKQLQALRWIKAYGMIGKVNAIILPGVNDQHIPEIARKVAAMGADIMNCIPVLPVEGTAFAHLPEPDAKMRFAVRTKCSEHVNQMTHCARCRADAVGKLGHQNSAEMDELLRSCARLPIDPSQDRPYVAVASREGMLVNQHLGETLSFTLFGEDPDNPGDYVEVGTRSAPPSGGRDERWSKLGDTLSDCRALLVAAAGTTPKAALMRKGIQIVEMEGMIESGLDSIFQGTDLPPVLQRTFTGCSKGAGCGGDGTGCG
jgi:nitrogen fixation protein NifB